MQCNAEKHMLTSFLLTPIQLTTNKQTNKQTPLHCTLLLLVSISIDPDYNLTMGDLADDDIMQCTQHPFKTPSPTATGGICPLCLQDKLGKLVSSSSSFLPLSSASSSVSSTTTTSLSFNHHSTTRFPNQTNATSASATPTASEPVTLKRSKSTTHYASRPRGFRSFFHLPHRKPSTASTKPLPTPALVQEEAEKVDTVNTPKNTSYQGKVTRSRSVGCGSRSFSGDFFEKISTGLSECTLRRVESQREGSGRIKHRHSTSTTAIREKVLCGGLFGGFMMITTSSSTSSYWTSSDNANSAPSRAHQGRSWGWALPSPRRAFSSKTHVVNGNESGHTTAKNTTTTTTTNSSSSKTTNLGEIPSLLSVRG